MATSDEFVIDRTLGEGAFGKVYLVTGSDDKKKYAMKVIDLKKAPEEERELALREASLLKTLDHDNVLKYTDSFEANGALCIVTEFCAHGDLSEFLDRRNSTKTKLEEDQLTEWFRQLASALDYLHGKKIIHRDVKTPNVFLTEKWTTKLGDMGLAKVLEKPSQKAVTFCGSPYYMSPEIFSCKPYGDKSDIWALGVIVYEMATLERPFDATLMHQLVFKIVHGTLPEMPKGYRQELTDILSIMLQKDPDMRPSAAVLLSHKFFKGMKAPALPPRPDASGASGLIKSRYNIQRPDPARGHKDADRAYRDHDLGSLLSTLAQIRKNEKDDAKGGANAKVGAARPQTIGLKSILIRSTQPPPPADPGRKKKYKKDVTLQSPTKPSDFDITMKSVGENEDEMASAALSMSGITLEERKEERTIQVNAGMKLNAEDFSKTLVDVQNKTATEAINVMQMIVRTMTGVFPRNIDDEALSSSSKDPQAVMLRQIEHLQYYCTRILNNDLELFQEVYTLIGMEKDEHKLEEQLISILGHEKFGLCGVHLMFLKNFEYNIGKLQEKRI